MHTFGHWKLANANMFFHTHHPLEEYLIAAGVVVDTLLSIEMPVWVVTFHLSKPLGRNDYAKLWHALTDHGVCEHGFAINTAVSKVERKWTGFQFKRRVGQDAFWVLDSLFPFLNGLCENRWAQVEDESSSIDFGNGLRRFLDLAFASFAHVASNFLFSWTCLWVKSLKLVWC